MIAHPLVDTLVMTCQYDEVAFQRELIGDMLVEALPVGRGEDHLVVVALGLQCRDTAVDGFTLHHHTGTAAIGIVIHAAPFVEGVVTQVVPFFSARARIDSCTKPSSISGNTVMISILIYKNL